MIKNLKTFKMPAHNTALAYFGQLVSYEEKNVYSFILGGLITGS